MLYPWLCMLSNVKKYGRGRGKRKEEGEETWMIMWQEARGVTGL